MERLVQLVIQDDEADSDTLSTLGQCLCGALHGTWSRSVFPASVTPESIGELDTVYCTQYLYLYWRNCFELVVSEKKDCEDGFFYYCNSIRNPPLFKLYL